MKKFELTILGSNSALPAYGRFTTSQVINYNEQPFLIDCGEGAQVRMSEYKIKRHKIDRVFISHLHGDHIYGLPGFIMSLNLNNRKRPLHIFGPPGLKEYLEVTFRIGEAHLSFEIEVMEMTHTEKVRIWENSSLEVWAFPVYHRIPTYGYLFQEKTSTKNINKEKIAEYGLTVDQIKSAKQGQDVEINGKRVPNSELTLPLEAPRSYAYCADSRTDERLIPVVSGVDLLYFETTYLHDLVEQAELRGHATAKQVGEFARKAKVKSVVTGHYSSRYKDVNPIKEEVLKEFDSVHLGYDGLMINIRK